MRIQDAVQRLADPDSAVRDEALAAVVAAKATAGPVLVEALRRPGAPVGRIALLLAALGTRAGIEPLCEITVKGVLDIDARGAVARSLAELLLPRDAATAVVRRAVLLLSRDMMAQTKKSAVRALANLADDDARRRLDELAQGDLDADVREAARDALAALPPQPAPPAVATRATTVTQTVVTQTVVTQTTVTTSLPAGEVAVDFEALVRQTVVVEEVGPWHALIRQLGDPRRPARDAAVEALVDAGADAVDAVVDALTAREPGARFGACLALLRLRAPRAVMPLALLATGDDIDDDLRAVALKSLAASLTGEEHAVASLLLPLARAADPFVRAGALLCLGRLGDRAGTRVAVLALGDPHDHVREAAAVALSEGAREDHVDLVLPLLAALAVIPTPKPEVQEAVLLALAHILGDDPPIVVRVRHRVRRLVLGRTSSLRKHALGILERCYDDEDPPPFGLVDDAASRLRDDHPEVRLMAASFLARHLAKGFPGVVPQLVDAVRRDERALALVSLDALARHGTPEARAALDAAAGTAADPAVQARAAELRDALVPQERTWSRRSG